MRRFKGVAARRRVIKPEAGRRWVEDYSWRELPISLEMSLSATTEHDNRVPVGAIETLEWDGDILRMTGTIRNSPDGDEAFDRIDSKAQRFVSSSAVDMAEPVLEVLDDNGEWVPANGEIPVDAEYRTFIAWKEIASICLVSEPADNECVIEVEEEANPDLVAAANSAPVFPADVFAKRSYSELTPLSWMFDERIGRWRCAGHYAGWDQTHTGVGVKPPRKSLLRTSKGRGWARYQALTPEGPVNVGPLTMGPHIREAAQSYAATVRMLEDIATQCGVAAWWEDEHGIQLAGVLDTDLTDAQIERITSRGYPSAVWFREGGRSYVAGVTIVTEAAFDPRVDGQELLAASVAFSDQVKATARKLRLYQLAYEAANERIGS